MQITDQHAVASLLLIAELRSQMEMVQQAARDSEQVLVSKNQQLQDTVRMLQARVAELEKPAESEVDGLVLVSDGWHDCEVSGCTVNHPEDPCADSDETDFDETATYLL